MIRNRCVTSLSVSAEVGSSMISTSESNDTAFAISTIWRLATVSVRTSVSGSMSIDSRSNSAAVRRRSSA